MPLKRFIGLIGASLLLAACSVSVPTSDLRPDPESLLVALEFAAALELDAHQNFDYATFRGDFLTSAQARSIFGYVQADLLTYYPDGFPDADRLLASGRLPSHLWRPPDPIWHLTGDGIIAQLNTTVNQPFQGNTFDVFEYSVTPYKSRNATGDDVWILEVVNPEANLHGWLLARQDLEGLWTRVPGGLGQQNIQRGANKTLHIVSTSPENGQPAYLLEYDPRPLGSLTGGLEVYGWQGGTLVKMTDIDLSGHGLDSWRLGQAGDQLQIEIESQGSTNFGCLEIQTLRYSWTAGGLVIDPGQPLPAPGSSQVLCDLAGVISPLSNGSSADIISELMPLVSEPELPAELALLANIHLMMAYAGSGQPTAAKQILDQIGSNESADPVADVIRQLATSGDPWAFCINFPATALQAGMEGSLLWPYLRPSTLFEVYGSSESSPRGLLCPLTQSVIGLARDQDLAPNAISTLTGLALLDLSEPTAVDDRYQMLQLLLAPRPILFLDGNGSWKTLPAMDVISATVEPADAGESGQPRVHLKIAVDPYRVLPDGCSGDVFEVPSWEAIVEIADGALNLLLTRCAAPISEADISEISTPLDPSVLVFPEVNDSTFAKFMAQDFESRLWVRDPAICLGYGTWLDTIVSELEREISPKKALIGRLIYGQAEMSRMCDDEDSYWERLKTLVDHYPDTAWAGLAQGRLP
jgi:hypothetical protein